MGVALRAVHPEGGRGGRDAGVLVVGLGGTNPDRLR